MHVYTSLKKERVHIGKETSIFFLIDEKEDTSNKKEKQL
jgi:hypothetical protein